MDIKTRHIGTSIIEVTFEGWNSTITEDATNLKGLVDEQFIQALRSVADELEDHNNNIKKQI